MQAKKLKKKKKLSIYILDQNYYLLFIMYLHFIAHLKTIDLTPDKTRVDKLLLVGKQDQSEVKAFPFIKMGNFLKKLWCCVSGW